MHKTLFYIKWMLLLIIASTVSCRNDDDKKAPEATKATVEAVTDSSAKSDSAGMKKNNVADVPEPAANKKDKDTAAAATVKTKKTEKKITESNRARRDTAASIKSALAPVSKNEKAAADVPVTNQSAAKSVTTDAVNKPFVSKYGIIPRNANENNLTVFFNTFPDKHTLIKVNFDGPADAEMNSVKTQIIKVLKKSGYVNVSDHSETIEPKQMPKDIHYELQHDGSVVFWVPIANQE
jgi:hypothetical protein